MGTIQRQQKTHCNAMHCDTPHDEAAVEQACTATVRGCPLPLVKRPKMNSQLTLRVDELLRRRLDRLAQLQDRHLTDLARVLLKRSVEDLERELDLPPLDQNSPGHGK